MAIFHPLIFIPGFPGTELLRGSQEIFPNLLLLLSASARPEALALLEGPDDLTDLTVRPGKPIEEVADLLIFDLIKQADSLYQLLGAEGYDVRTPNAFFRPLGWDWRKPVDDDLVMGDLLETVAGLLARTGQKPMVVVHSTGGLVLRAFLERHPERAEDLAGVLAFGVPWAGTPRPFDFLAGLRAFAPFSREETQRVLAHAWSAYSLLPSGDSNEALGLVVDGAGQPIDPLVSRDWFPDGLAPVMGPRADRAQGAHSRNLLPEGVALPPDVTLPVINVVGFGTETPNRAVIEGGEVRVERELYAEAPLDDGDGTIPRRSAAWLRGDNVLTFHTPLGIFPGVAVANRHMTLWGNPGGKELLARALTFEEPRPFLHAACDPDDVFNQADRITVRLVALDAAGEALPGVRVRLSDLQGGDLLVEPAGVDGRYALTLERQRLRRVHGGRFLRFSLEVAWEGGSKPLPPFVLPV